MMVFDLQPTIYHFKQTNLRVSYMRDSSFQKCLTVVLLKSNKNSAFGNISHSLTSSLLINQFFDTNTPKIFNCMLFSCHVQVSE